MGVLAKSTAACFTSRERSQYVEPFLQAVRKSSTQMLVVSEWLDEYGISRYFCALPQMTIGHSLAWLVPPTTGPHSNDLLGQQL